MKSSLALAVIASLFVMNTSATHQVVDSHKKLGITWTDAESVGFYVGGSRGYWFGYVEGLYNFKQPLTNDQCLTPLITDKITTIITDLASFRLSIIFSLLNDYYFIVANLQEGCGLTETVADVKAFCTANSCSFTTIIANCSANLFKLIDNFNTILAVFT